MSGKILLELMTTGIYAFLVYDGFNRFLKDTFFLAIYLLFYTFVYVFAMLHLIFDKEK